MSQEERFGTRDLSYSAWHRVRSLARFVGLERAQTLSMVDADVVLFLELDHWTREPLALIEISIDVGQSEKPSSATARLASRAGLPAYCVLYRLSTEKNPASPYLRDIDRFRVRRLWPSPEHAWRDLSPSQWAKALLNVRNWAAARIGAEPANDGAWEEIPKQGILFQEEQAQH